MTKTVKPTGGDSRAPTKVSPSEPAASQESDHASMSKPRELDEDGNVDEQPGNTLTDDKTTAVGAEEKKKKKNRRKKRTRKQK